MKKILPLFVISSLLFASEPASSKISTPVQASLGALNVESQEVSAVGSRDDLYAVTGAVASGFPRLACPPLGQDFDANDDHRPSPPRTVTHRAASAPAMMAPELLIPDAAKQNSVTIEFIQAGCTLISQISGSRNAVSCCVLMRDQEGICAYDAASMKFTMFYNRKHMERIPLRDCSGRLELERVLNIPNIFFCFPKQSLAKLPPFVLIETAFCFLQAGIINEGFDICPVNSLNYQARIERARLGYIPFSSLDVARIVDRSLAVQSEHISFEFSKRGCVCELPDGMRIPALSCNILIQSRIYAYEAHTETFVPISNRGQRIRREVLLNLPWEAVHFPRENFSNFHADMLLNVGISLARKGVPGGSLLNQGFYIFPIAI